MTADGTGMKTCCKCGQSKPLAEYGKNKQLKDGLRNDCKDCQAEDNRRYRAANREAIAEKRRQAHAANPEPARRRAREWREANLERAREHDRERAKANPEKKKQEHLRWRCAHREHLREWMRQWKAAHPERVKELNRKYSQAHPEKALLNVNKRRIRKAGNGGSHTVAEWDALCQNFGYRCACCGEASNLTRDHVIPVSLGGSDNIDNIQPLCLKCNSRKGTQTIDYRQQPDSPVL